MADLREQLLHLLPDGPSTVQMRALLELGETQLFGDAEGAAFFHAEAALGVLHGRPTAKTLLELRLAGGQPPQLLAHAPLELEGYAWERLSLSSGGGEDRGEEANRLTPELWPLVPEELSTTLANALERRVVFCALVDGRPVSFAWAPLRSEAWFDVQVHTLPAFRRQDLGRRVASALLRHERSEGRSPVWGASGEASLALGRALGFVESGQTLWRATKRV